MNLSGEVRGEFTKHSGAAGAGGALLRGGRRLWRPLLI